MSNGDPKSVFLGSERGELREADSSHGDWLHLIPFIPNRGGELRLTDIVLGVVALLPALGRQRQVDHMSSRLAWSTKQVPEQPGLHRENLSQNKQKQNNNIATGQ